jgi:hypothetical protein
MNKRFTLEIIQVDNYYTVTKSENGVPVSSEQYKYMDLPYEINDVYEDIFGAKEETGSTY